MTRLRIYRALILGGLLIGVAAEIYGLLIGVGAEVYFLYIWHGVLDY